MDSTTIDYLFYSEAIAGGNLSCEKDGPAKNNSDQYPISYCIQLCLERATTKSNNCPAVSQRVNWKKVDQEEYRDNLLKLLSDYDITSVSPSCIDNGVVKFNNILKTAATLAGPPAVRRMKKTKLVIWSSKIRCFLLEKKQAFNEWKRGGKPNNPSHPLLIAKREKRQALRRVCRIQMAAKHNEERQEIL